MKIEVNGQPREVADTATVADLVGAFVSGDSAGTAIAVDGEVIRRTEWSATRVAAGARVEIVRATQGG